MKPLALDPALECCRECGIPAGRHYLYPSCPAFLAPAPSGLRVPRSIAEALLIDAIAYPISAVRFVVQKITGKDLLG